MTIPIVMTKAGRQNADPSALRSDLITDVTALSPGYTANLPASLIEDLSSTAVGALATMDQGVTEAINSVTPYGANLFILNQQATMHGVTIGSATNTSVYVVFTGTPGFLIPKGFIVSDGTYQYTVVDGGIVGSATSGSATGVTQPLYCLATVSGIWAVAINTVTTLITSVPTSIALSVTNLITGTPGTTGPNEEDTRSQVLQAYQAVSTGLSTTLRKNLGQVPGVLINLVSVQPSTTGIGYKVIVPGGDPFLVAYAIYISLFDVSSLIGSTIDPTRNVTVSVNDYPDVFPVLYVVPPVQTVTMTVQWNIQSSNLVISTAAIAALAQQPLANYINAIPTGKPINTLELQNVFQAAVANVIPLQLLTRLVFTVYINGVATSVTSGTGIILGDTEGYFFTTPSQITVNQG